MNVSEDRCVKMPIVLAVIGSKIVFSCNLPQRPFLPYLRNHRKECQIWREKLNFSELFPKIILRHDMSSSQTSYHSEFADPANWNFEALPLKTPLDKQLIHGCLIWEYMEVEYERPNSDVSCGRSDTQPPGEHRKSRTSWTTV